MTDLLSITDIYQLQHINGKCNAMIRDIRLKPHELLSKYSIKTILKFYSYIPHLNCFIRDLDLFLDHPIHSDDDPDGVFLDSSDRTLIFNLNRVYNILIKPVYIKLNFKLPPGFITDFKLIKYYPFNIRSVFDMDELTGYVLMNEHYWDLLLAPTELVIVERVPIEFNETFFKPRGFVSIEEEIQKLKDEPWFALKY